MKKFEVEVQRTETRTHTFYVNAESKSEGTEIALEQAYDFDFSNASSISHGDYGITSLNEIDIAETDTCHDQTKRGSWSISFNGVEPSELSLENIAKLIKDGYIEGVYTEDE